MTGKFIMKFCLLMILLLGLTSSSEAEVKPVTRGWIVPENGFFMPLETGRDIYNGWRSAENDVDIYKKALQEAQQQYEKLIFELKMKRTDKRRWGIGFGAGLSHKNEGVLMVGIVYQIL